MNATLRRPSPAGVDIWLAADIAQYAADLAASGMDDSAAAESARAEQAELLPGSALRATSSSRWV